MSEGESRVRKERRRRRVASGRKEEAWEEGGRETDCLLSSRGWMRRCIEGCVREKLFRIQVETIFEIPPRFKPSRGG